MFPQPRHQLWNVSIKEENAPISQFLWEGRSWLLPLSCKPTSCHNDIRNLFFLWVKAMSTGGYPNYQVNLGPTLCDKLCCPVLFILRTRMEWVVSARLHKRVRFLSLLAVSYQITCNSHHILVQACSITTFFSFLFLWGGFLGWQGILFLYFPNTCMPRPLFLFNFFFTYSSLAWAHLIGKT